MQNALLREIASHCDRAAIVPICRLNDLARDMEELEAGDYHTGYIDWAAKRRERFHPKDLGFEARSVLVVATHCPRRTVTFTRGGRSVQATLPPTYADYEALEAEVLRYVNAFLNPRGLHAAPAYHLPNKLLAVRGALGEYGRNNIFYCDDWGSYVNLVALYTDAPCKEHLWRLARRMQDCDKCHACAGACPTGAIDAGRRIIDAGRCLTNLNEGKEPQFPQWVDKGAHNSLVGCMRCQACCPRNAPNASFVAEGCAFDEGETQCILDHKAGEEYPEELAQKIKGIGMHWYRDVLNRNLAALLAR